MSDNKKAVEKLTTMNRNLVGLDRKIRIDNVILRQNVAYLVDSARPGDPGQCTVPEKIIADLKALLYQETVLLG